jgi:hypothetical protein
LTTTAVTDAGLAMSAKVFDVEVKASKQISQIVPDSWIKHI